MIKAVKDKRARRHHGTRLPVGPNGGIQLLLIANVTDLGKAGDLVEVKPGYAKNYLIPQGLATVATEQHRRQLEERKAQLEELHRQKVADCQALAAQIKANPLRLTAKTNDEGNLYGSIYKDEISKALKAKGLDVAPSQVGLEGPIKVTGIYEVPINLCEGVDAKLDVTVDRE